MESTVVECIIQAGAVGIAIVALVLVNTCVKTMTNHLTDVTARLVQMATILERLERKLLD